jgi:iduronate 2-sulfatase
MFLRPRVFLLVVLAGYLSTVVASVADEPRPNVLFIMADDFRVELGASGSAALTPNLDRLAKAGIQFERAYCQQALCNPSRSSMLTGRRPDTLRLWHNGTHFREITPDVTTLPLWFKQHGYTTRCVGKIYHNWHTKEKGDRRSWVPEFLHYANHGEQAAGEGHASRSRDRAEVRVPRVPDEAYFDGRVAAEAVRVMAEVKGGPFFLAVGFWKPHAPFNAPKKYWDLYERGKLPPLDRRRPEGAPEIAFHDGRELRGLPPNQLTFTSEQAAEIRHGYFANIAFLDAQVGKVLDALARLDLTRRTIVVFAGDHGYHVGEHDLWAKTSNFELDARVPLLVSVPGNKNAGRRSQSLAELLDLFPTLVELCRLPVPAGLEGTSLVSALNDPAKSVKPAAFTQHPRPAYFDREPDRVPKAMGYSVRTPRVRYTEWRDWKTGETIGRELYDHAKDPAEMRNAIDAPPLAEFQREAEKFLQGQFPLK